MLFDAAGRVDILDEQPRGKPRGIKTKDICKCARSKGRGIGPGEIKNASAIPGDDLQRFDTTRWRAAGHVKVFG